MNPVLSGQEHLLFTATDLTSHRRCHLSVSSPVPGIQGGNTVVIVVTTIYCASQAPSVSPHPKQNRLGTINIPISQGGKMRLRVWSRQCKPVPTSLTLTIAAPRYLSLDCPLVTGPFSAQHVGRLQVLAAKAPEHGHLGSFMLGRVTLRCVSMISQGFIIWCGDS